MKLSTRTELDVPAATLFAAFCDTAHWEAAARWRGAKVRRTDAGSDAVAGATWEVVAKVKGKPRDLRISLNSVTSPTEMAFSGVAKMFSGTATLRVTSLSLRRTRVSVGIEITPNTLPARLMLQSARLAKGRIERRFAERVHAALANLGARLVDR
jgi:uncharacterized protein YndB with AHSA1/START domain